MSNVYKLLKYFTRIRSNRVKAMALWMMHAAGRRYLNVNIDPVIGCNLRCQMCFFSSSEGVQTERMSTEQFQAIADGLFSRVMRLQIGCSAEPTLHRDLANLVGIARSKGVPFISITTNGNILSRETLEACVANGLNELCLSCHGFTQPVYETLMEHGRYPLFLNLLQSVREVKRKYPDFKLRINFTINNDNKEDLQHIWDVVSDELDVLQIRPIQNLGDSKYQDFDLSAIKAGFDHYIGSIVEECKRRNILCLAPTEQSLDVLTQQATADGQEPTTDYNPIMEFAYCYVSPSFCWKDNYNPSEDTFASYAKRTHLGRKIFKSIFKTKNKVKKDVPTVVLNYSVK